MQNEPNWDALAAQAEAGELKPIKGTEARGEAAAQLGREFLLAATGTSDLESAMRVAVGRPPLGAVPSNVTWKVRAPEELQTVVAELLKQAGHDNRSELIRVAVLEYAQKHLAA